MTILVSARTPGLLSGLEQRLGGSTELRIIDDGERLFQLVADPASCFDALMLDDSITPRPGQDVYTSLWEIIALITHRPAPVPIMLTMRDRTPGYVVDALRSEVLRTGGTFQVLSHRVTTADHPEARTVVAAMLDRLPAPRRVTQYWIAGTSIAGGTGKSNTLNNMMLYLVQRGVRVLQVEFDISQGSLMTFYHVRPDDVESITTLPDECPRLITTYPPEMVQRRVYRHPAGVDLLLAGQGVRDPRTMEPRHLEGLADTLPLLDYDLVCFDLGTELKQNHAVIRLFMHGLYPVVICQAGRKEREGARAVLDVLGQLGLPDGTTVLERATVAFIASERGHVKDIRDVRMDILRQYPMVTDLGIIPRDPTLLSLAAERPSFVSIFDVNPRAPYALAIRDAALQWVETVGFPGTRFTADDPLRRRAWWSFWRRPVPAGAAAS